MKTQTICKANPGRKYDMLINITCNRNMEKNKINFTNIGTDECSIKLKAEALEACPLFSLTYLFEKYAGIFSLVFIGVGVFVALFGEKLFHIVLFLLTTFLVAFIILMFVTEVVISSYTKDYAIWVILGISGAIGLVCGYFVVAYEEYCFALAGAFLGGVLGLFLYNLVLAKYVPPVSYFSFPLIYF